MFKYQELLQERKNREAPQRHVVNGAAVPGQQVQDVLPHVGAAGRVVVDQFWS